MWLAGCWTSLGGSPDQSESGRSSISGDAWGWLGVGSAPPCRPAPGWPSTSVRRMRKAGTPWDNRTGRQVYSADKAEAAWFVREQWPPAEAVVLAQNKPTRPASRCGGSWRPGRVSRRWISSSPGCGIGLCR